MMPPDLVFVLFALLAAAGAYWIAASRRGRRAGFGAALVTLALFAALFAGMVALLRAGGIR
jgi:hypothetical protein